MLRTILITLFFVAACSQPQETQTPVASATHETGTSTVTTSTAAETSTISVSTAASGTDVPISPTTNPPSKAEPSAVRGPKLMPVDEATREPSLVRFRADLLAAVRKHDVDAVMKAADPKIRTSFGAGGGEKEFRRLLEQPDSRIWSELERILPLGGTFQKGGDVQRFWAPYVYSAWPESGPDAFVALAVTDRNVPLHATKDPKSPVIATLSYDIVTPAGKDKYKTADGRVGWVDPKYLRSPIGYRAGFVRSGATWKMEALVSGD